MIPDPTQAERENRQLREVLDALIQVALFESSIEAIRHAAIAAREGAALAADTEEERVDE